MILAAALALAALYLASRLAWAWMTRPLAAGDRDLQGLS